MKLTSGSCAVGDTVPAERKRGPWSQSPLSHIVEVVRPGTPLATHRRETVRYKTVATD